MISPETLASSNTEHGHQSAYFCALVDLAHSFPEVRWIHAIPNGGSRDVVTSGRLKAEGVRAGVWDVFIHVARGQWHGMYIEFKVPKRRVEKRGGLTEDHRAFGLAVHQEGYCTAVCYTWEEAIAHTLEYLRKEKF